MSIDNLEEDWANTTNEKRQEEIEKDVKFLKETFNSEFPTWVDWEEFVIDWWDHFQDINRHEGEGEE